MYQPASLRTPEAQAELRAAGADVMVVAAYGLILPQAVLDLPRFGCLNIHASLLPRWRGAAPIQRAILAGDTRNRRHHHADGRRPRHRRDAAENAPCRFGIPTPRPACTTLWLRQAPARSLRRWRITPARVPQAQDDALATYAAKLSKDEARLDWPQPADALARAVRAYNPAPGAWTLLDGVPLKIWSAQAVASAGALEDADPLRAEACERPYAPGEVLHAAADRLVVACGSGALDLQEIQPAGGKRMTAAAFLAGRPLPPGTRFGV